MVSAARVIALCEGGSSRGAAVDFEFGDLCQLEEEEPFSGADDQLEVAAGVSVDDPAVSIGGLEAGVAGAGADGFKGAVVRAGP